MTRAVAVLALALAAALFTPAAAAEPGDALSPAEAAEVQAQTEALAAEREAEARAGLLPSDAEVAGVAFGAASRLGARSPLRLRVQGAVGDRLGPDLFCVRCGGPEPFAQKPGTSGLDAIDLRVARYRFDIPIEVNDEVRQVLHYFAYGSGRPHFERWLARAQRFVPLIVPILESYGLPKDLVFVSMIESGFSTHAYSTAAAVGPWQFIADTAKLYRLRMDAWVDERRDPVKATHAAARFLGWLYKEFDDWYLAFAGYNGGPTRVRRTIDAAGTRDYWELCRAKRLPRETCGYVPKIIAAAIISRYPEAFGFGAPVDPSPPFDYEEVEIPAPVDLQDVARVSESDFETLKALNPELRRWVTPPPLKAKVPYVLRLPPGARASFEARASELKAAKSSFDERHRIQAGDTLWKLAQRYGCTVEELVAVNGIRDARSLRLGMELVVPLRPGAAAPPPPKQKARAAAPKKAPPPRAEAPAVVSEGRYQVAAGDTLWSIAQRHGVTTKELCAANGLVDGSHVPLSIGQSLRIPGEGTRPLAAGAPPPRKAPRHHVLQAGETLWQLSRRYGCSVEELRRWNGIRDDRSLRVGQTLIVER